MKKQILALAFAAVSAITFSSFAQTPCSNSQCPQQKECTKQVCPKAKTDECCLASSFDKMNLSDKQKEQVKALQQERLKSRRLNKQRCDSAGRAYRMSEKLDYLSNLKKIVGPENYVIFLEDYYINGSDKRPGKNGKAVPGRPHKAHKGSRR